MSLNEEVGIHIVHLLTCLRMRCSSCCLIWIFETILVMLNTSGYFNWKNVI